MYSTFFGLKDSPFSIAPDPRFLYMSERHREGLAHLLYGVSNQGGFVLLTGEVGTGKTTVCRCFLEQVPDNTDIAFIVHPKVTGRELLASICDELGIPYTRAASIKVLVDLINAHLLKAHANGRNTVLIIDEAQNLSIEVLEQLRLLTNLETSEKKLLQIVLLGQPELLELLQKPELRQLSQRITARYHLKELSREDVRAYVHYRLSVAGLKREVFTPAALKSLYKLSQGVPRLINLICDRAMLGAYARHSEIIDRNILRQAAREVLGEQQASSGKKPLQSIWLRGAALGISAGLALFIMFSVWESRIRSSGQEELVEQSRQLIVDTKAESLETVELSAEGGTQDLESGPVDNQGKIIRSAEKQPEGLEKSVMNLPGSSQVAAYRNVLSRWGLDYENGHKLSPCQFAESFGLSCLQRQGNWRSLVRLDRPAVLKLYSPLGQEFYVAVIELLDEERALISLGEEKLVAAVSEIDTYWAGDYTLIWKLPPFSSTLIRANGSEREQSWLAEQLERIESVKAEPGVEKAMASSIDLSAAVDAVTLEERLRNFQLGVGLIPDGIAGAHTLIHMSSILDPDVPRLRGMRDRPQLGGTD